MSEQPLFDDTSAEAEAVLIEGYRRMTPEQKFNRIRDLNWTLQELALSELRVRHPDDDERTLRLRFAARKYDRATMIAAFGWDPLVDG